MLYRVANDNAWHWLVRWLQNPSILLLDESTSALDAPSDEEFLEFGAALSSPDNRIRVAPDLCTQVGRSHHCAQPRVIEEQGTHIS